MYQTLHEARCDRCKRTYSSVSNPKIDGWGEVTVEDIGGNDYPYDPDRFHLCPSCRGLHREFMENSAIPVSGKDDEPLAAWERELLAKPEDVAGAAGTILDALADILYPLDEYADHQWNGGDVCEAVAELLGRYRPDARLRQPLAPRYGFAETGVLYHHLRSDGWTLCGLHPATTGLDTDGRHECLNCSRILSGVVVASDIEPEHKHEWRWSNTRWEDRITRRYCVDCGVLFTDL
jgi:hypothetical protein